MRVKQLSSEECYSALAEARFGRLACAHDNRPYIVPTYFAVEDYEIYAFTLPGQKLDFMRQNPKVCLEVDQMRASDDWLSVVAAGRYEELPDTPDYAPLRKRAHALLQERPMWWEPGGITGTDYDQSQRLVPVYYRVGIDHMTGYRGMR